MKVIGLIRQSWPILLGLFLMVAVPMVLLRNHHQKNQSYQADDLIWHKWYPGIIEVNRPNGRIIWLNYTADWSATIKVNEMTLLSDQQVIAALHRHGVMMVKVDCTFPEPEIQAELKRYRNPVLPKNFLIPSDPDAPYLQLPELVTPEVFLVALKKARHLSFADPSGP